MKFLRNIKFLALLLMVLLGGAKVAVSQTNTLPSGTSSDPFETLDVVNRISNAGTYYFNIDGVAFNAYVDADGYIAVYTDVIPQTGASSIEEGNGGATPRRAYTQLGKKTYLDTDILAKMENAISLRMVSIPVKNDELYPGGTRLNLTTPNRILIDRVLNNVALGLGSDEAIHLPTWSGIGIEYLEATCVPGGANTLAEKVYHACGNFDGLHWIPVRAKFQVDYNGDDNRSAQSDERLLPGSAMLLLLKFSEPKLQIEKTAAISGNPSPAVAKAGDTITYTYRISNVGTAAAVNVTVNDMHISQGAFDQPNIETATIVTSASGQIANTDLSNSAYDMIGVGDVIQFTATYTVTEEDMYVYGDK